MAKLQDYATSLIRMSSKRILNSCTDMGANLLLENESTSKGTRFYTSLYSLFNLFIQTDSGNLLTLVVQCCRHIAGRGKLRHMLNVAGGTFLKT